MTQHRAMDNLSEQFKANVITLVMCGIIVGTIIWFCHRLG